MVSKVFMICDAYESGFGHGIKQDGLDLSKTPHGDPELGEAYQIGYEAGAKRAAAAAAVAKPLGSVTSMEEFMSQYLSQADSGCWCHKCNSGKLLNQMILCPDCGNKRCPHASNHRYACTNSNEPGQAGSVY